MNIEIPLWSLLVVVCYVKLTEIKWRKLQLFQNCSIFIGKPAYINVGMKETCKLHLYGSWFNKNATRMCESTNYRPIKYTYSRSMRNADILGAYLLNWKLFLFLYKCNFQVSFFFSESIFCSYFCQIFDIIRTLNTFLSALIH